MAAIAGLAVVKIAENSPSKSEPPTKSAATQATQIEPEPEKPKKPEKQFMEVRGLHVTGWIAGGKKSFGKLVDLVNETELNALCIDIKDSDGVLSYDTDVPLAREIKASRHAIGDIDYVMKTMEENNIYPIARIAVFKDPIIAKMKPELAVTSTKGGIWLDRHRTGWANPYKKEVWDYNIDIAIDAAKRGFKEIQWDYVRFPSDGPISTCVYPGKDGRNQSEVIQDFLEYARKRLEPYGVVISADIFGLTSLTTHDMGIGQTVRMIAENVDYICPMVYPSHYAKYEYGIPHPNAAPYQTVRYSLGDHLEEVEGTKAKVRPWLQDFSLYGVHYGRDEVIAQRKAAAEMGVTEFLLWNPRCVYTKSALSSDPNKPPKEIEAALKAAPFRVVLKTTGPNKESIRAIVEKSTGKEKADRILSSLPNPVASNLTWKQASQLAKEFRDSGATVDIR